MIHIGKERKREKVIEKEKLRDTRIIDIWFFKELLYELFYVTHYLFTFQYDSLFQQTYIIV